MNASDGTTKSASLDREARLALYPDDLTVREARASYFARSGFTAATYTDPWVAPPPWGEALLYRPLGELRARVAIPDDAVSGPRDVVALAGHAVLGAAIHLAPVVAAVIAVAALIGSTG